MSKREDFIGAWVSEQEKREIIELAKGMDMSVSDLIRHRIIRPMMTLPEAIQNLKLYIDTKFNKINELVKKEIVGREPTQRIYTEIYEPIERISQSEPIDLDLDITGLKPEKYKIKMKKVLIEMEKLIKNGQTILEITPREEVERKRAKTDPVAYLEWKTKKKQ